MIDYLTAPDVPITEPSVTYERLWVERTIAAAFAICPTCAAWGSAPCVTKSGNVTARHARRPR